MSAKIKTHRGAAKRFKKTANGYKHRATGRNHILTKKPKKRKRQLNNTCMVNSADKRSVSNMLNDR